MHWGEHIGTRAGRAGVRRARRPWRCEIMEKGELMSERPAQRSGTDGPARSPSSRRGWCCMTLPAAAASDPGPLLYDLERRRPRRLRVSVAGGRRAWTPASAATARPTRLAGPTSRCSPTRARSRALADRRQPAQADARRPPAHPRQAPPRAASCARCRRARARRSPRRSQPGAELDAGRDLTARCPT